MHFNEYLSKDIFE